MATVDIVREQAKWRRDVENGTIGGGGGGPAGLPSGYLTGFETNPNSVNPTEEIDFGPGSARSTDDTEDIVVTTGLTKDLTAVWAAGDNMGGRSSSTAISPNTTFHLFVIKDSGTGDVDFGFDVLLNAAGLLADSGYDEYRRIGSILIDGSSDIRAYQQIGNRFTLDEQIRELSTGTGNTGGATLILTGCPLGLEVLADTHVLYSDTDTSYLLITETWQQNLAADANNYTLIASAGSNARHIGLEWRTDTTRQIRWRTDQAAISVLQIWTKGWEDPRADFVTGGGGGGPVAANEEFCPSYSSYTRVSDTELTVDLVNAVNTYTNRRVRIKDNSGNSFFGVVNAIDFNSTAANDTYMSLTMEGSDTVPNTITDVCVTSNTANWSPIAGDPFNGDPINDIATGIIGATQWWFAVGNNGKVATSSDAGQNWVLRSTTTTEHLRACTYDTVNETFWGGGDAGVLVSTTDGVNITEDTTSIPALTSGGDGRIRGMTYTETGFDGIQIIFLYSGNYGSAYTITQGASWVVADTSVTGTPFGNHALESDFDTADTPGDSTRMIRTGNTLTRFFTNITVADASGDSLGGGNTPSAMGFFNDGTSPDARVYGITNGDVVGQSNWIGDDTVTFLEQHNDMAYSSFHDRLVSVGNNGQIGYWDGADKNLNSAWNVVTNGFDPTANIQAVAWNNADGVFVAVADNGQICRSANGTN